MDTILGAVIGIGALTIGGIFRLSYQQGNFHGLVIKFMEATDRRLGRLETKGDQRDARNEGRHDRGEPQ